MSADDDEDLIGVPERGITQGEWAAGFLNQSRADQAGIMAKAFRRDPTVAGAILFPELDDPSRVEASMDLKRLVHQDAVQEAYRLVRASRAEPVWPRPLVFTAEQVQNGSLAAPEPTVGGLLYPGRVSTLYGTHTAGKTWTALYLARCNAESGGRTLILDYEDTEAGIAARCVAMTGDLELARCVLYYAPSGVLTAASVAPAIEARDVSLVIIDSVGEAMAASGYDPNSELDVARWYTEVPDAVAKLGPAVLNLDHIAKRQDGTPSPVGSFRKSAAVTGAQFALENRVGFSRDQAGWSRLTCTKDRNGSFATGQVVGRVDFIPKDGRMEVSFKWGDTERPGGPADPLEQAILSYVVDRIENVHGQMDDNGEVLDGRPNITQIREAVKKGGVPAHNSKIREAVDRLVHQGWLAPVHIKSGKTTRDVFVPGDGGLSEVEWDEAVP